MIIHDMASQWELDQLFRLHRWRVMSLLVNTDEIPFVDLRDKLGMTDGNLFSLLRKLEQAELIEKHKQFKGLIPLTAISATERGRRVYEQVYEQVSRIHTDTRDKP